MTAKAPVVLSYVMSGKNWCPAGCGSTKINSLHEAPPFVDLVTTILA